MKHYRCAHNVEAMQWMDTDVNREVFAAWFAKHDCLFETLGPVVCLPEEGKVSEGEWILWSDGEFIVMEDEEFVSGYEEVPA